MSISRNLSKLGTNTNSSGTLQVTGGGTGVIVSIDYGNANTAIGNWA